MDRKTLQIINASNHSIIKLRGVYADWSRRHNINYNEMLVLYTIRENGYCTQKQVCDNYLLPRQTIHNVISRMREQNMARYSDFLKFDNGCVGLCCAFVIQHLCVSSVHDDIQRYRLRVGR